MKNNIPRFVLSLLCAILLPFVLVAQQAQDPHHASTKEDSFGPTVNNRIARNHSAVRHGGIYGVSSLQSSDSSRHIGAFLLNKKGAVSSQSAKLKSIQATSDNWQSYPIGGGEMTSIAVDNTNAQIVYVGTRAAGVYKSNDGGQTWQPSRTGLTFYPIRILKVVPQHSNILYAGTDFDGIWKTTDAGNSWIKSSEGLDESLIVFNIVIDSSNTNILYAGLAGGVGLSVGNIYKSEDAGATWVMKDTGIPRYSGTRTNGILALTLGPPGSGFVYAGTSNDGCFSSRDGGKTWQDMNNGVPFTSGTSSREEANAMATDPHHAYRPSANIQGSYYVYDSLQWRGVGGLMSSVGADHFYFHPASPSIIYDAGQYFNKSMDGGVTWRSILGMPTSLYLLNIPGIDDYSAACRIPEIAFNASSPNTVYAASQPVFYFSGGVFKSTDVGEHWTLSAQGITAAAIASVAIDPQNSNNIYAGDTYSASATGCLWRTQDGGKTWNKGYDSLGRNHDFRGVQGIAIDPINSSNVFLINDWGDLFHSIDQGTSFAHIDSVSHVGCIAIVPDTPRTIYLGGDFYGSGISKSSDGGITWMQKNTGIPMRWGRMAPINSLIMDPFNHHTVWATTENDSGAGLLKTIDAGEHWKFMPITDANIAVENMIMKPDAGNVMLAYGIYELTDRILKTIDGGNTWKVKLEGVTVTSFASDPRNSNVVYASTEGSGVIRSTDFGETWEDYSTGLVYPVLYSLAISHDPSPLLVAGSYGSGLYWVNPSKIVSGVAEKPTSSIPVELRLEQNYPNPFNPSTQISYSLPEAGRVSLTIYDVLGREIATLSDENKQAGRYTVTWNSTQNSGMPLSSGVYFARLRVTNDLGGVKFAKTMRLLLMK